MTDYHANEIPGPLDADAMFYDSDTLSDNTASTVIDLGSNFAPWPPRPLTVTLDVDTLDTDDGDGAYNFKLQSRAATTESWQDTGMSIPVKSTGTKLAVVGIRKRYVRLLPVITETTPSVKLSAYLTS